MNSKENLNVSAKSMKTTLFLAYVLTLGFFILVIASVINTYTKQSLIREVSLSRKDVLKQISERSNVVKNSSITVSNLFAYDPIVMTMLEAETVANRHHVDQYLREQKAIYDHALRDMGIDYDLIILGENGYNYHSQTVQGYNFDALKSQLWFKHIDEKNGDITFISSFNDRFGSDTNRYVFSASRKVYDDAGKVLGTLMINIDETYLYRLYNSLLDGTNTIYIVDKNGNVISHTNRRLRGLNYFSHENFKRLYPDDAYNIISKSDGDYLFSSVTDPQTGWMIIEEVPTTAVFKEVHRTLNLIMMITAACLMIALMISYYLADYMTRPLKILRGTMQELKDGDLTVRSHVESYTELNDLRTAFNEMAEQIDALLKQVVTQERYHRELELNFLRAQINPHFLYNTLFSIRCMGEMDRKEDFLKMLDAFMSLLKTSFSTDTRLIALRQELESTEKYLALQQIRYGNRFTFTVVCEPALYEMHLPALILQPLVENSIFHGFEAEQRFGTITLNLYEINETHFAIDVMDDGRGMDEALIASVQHQFSNYEVHPQNSIGLANVANRIHLTYGDEAKMDIISEAHVGTIIRIILPKGGKNHENSYRG